MADPKGSGGAPGGGPKKPVPAAEPKTAKQLQQEKADKAFEEKMAGAQASGIRETWPMSWSQKQSAMKALRHLTFDQLYQRYRSGGSREVFRRFLDAHGITYHDPKKAAAKLANLPKKPGGGTKLS